MNFSLYIFGTPNGYDQYPLDSNSTKFQEILTSCNSESQLSVLRDNQLIQYVYVRKISSNDGFCWGFGFALVVTGVYCLNCHTLNDLFETAFYDVLLKGKLFRYQGNSFSYQVSKFADDINEIKRINTFFKSKLEYELGDLFVTIPSSFSIGNGQTSISMKESASDINLAVENFDIVHITNNENSDIGRNPAKHPFPNPNRRLLWAILAVFLLFGSAVATYNIIHAIRAPRIRQIKDTYEKAICEFDRKSCYVVEDKQGNVGIQDNVIDAFNALQIMEQCENEHLFPKTEMKPVFKENLKQYRKCLSLAQNKLEERAEWDLGSDEYDDPKQIDMRARFYYIKYVMEQTKGNSVLNIHILPDSSSIPLEQLIEITNNGL